MDLENEISEVLSGVIDDIVQDEATLSDATSNFNSGFNFLHLCDNSSSPANLNIIDLLDLSSDSRIQRAFEYNHWNLLTFLGKLSISYSNASCQCDLSDESETPVQYRRKAPTDSKKLRKKRKPKSYKIVSDESEDDTTITRVNLSGRSLRPQKTFDEQPIDENRTFYQCTYCNEMFNSMGVFIRHRKLCDKKRNHSPSPAGKDSSPKKAKASKPKPSTSQTKAMTEEPKLLSVEYDLDDMSGSPSVIDLSPDEDNGDDQDWYPDDDIDGTYSPPKTPPMQNRKRKGKAPRKFTKSDDSSLLNSLDSQVFADVKPDLRADFACWICSDLNCNTYCGLVEHLQFAHPQVVPAACCLCGRWFDSYNRIRRHLLSTVHSDRDKLAIDDIIDSYAAVKFSWSPPSRAKVKVEPQDNASEEHICSICGKSFARKNRLMKHVAQMHSGTRVEELPASSGTSAKKAKKTSRCVRCSQYFDSTVDLEIHAKTDHKYTADVKQFTHACPACERIFNNAYSMNDHFEGSHTPCDIRILSCTGDTGTSGSSPSDSQTDPTISTLDQQRGTTINGELTNDDTKLFDCIICCRSFASKSQLSEHMDCHRVFLSTNYFIKHKQLPESITTALPNILRRQNYPSYSPMDDFPVLNGFADGPSQQHPLNFSMLGAGIFPGMTDDGNIQMVPAIPNSLPPRDPIPVEESPVVVDPTVGKLCCQESSECSGFTDAKDLIAHRIDAHCKLPVFMCLLSECSQIFDSSVDLIEHARASNHDQRAFICTACNEHFNLNNRSAFTGHKSNTHRWIKESEEFCSTCFRNFVSRSALGQHLDNCETHLHVCHKCGKILKSSHDLDAHEKAHDDPNVLICEQCGAMFEGNSALTRHLSRFHRNPEDRPRCDICDMTFATPSHLKRHHITRHTKEKPHTCTYPGCTKAFSRRDKLVQHQRYHLSERPFPCRVCDKSFASEDTRRMHESKHNTQDLICHHCRENFNSIEELKSHMELIHGVHRPIPTYRYECPECKQTFTRQNKLSRHRESSHGVGFDWPYKCPHCSKGYQRSHQLDKHVTSKHVAHPNSVSAKGKPAHPDFTNVPKVPRRPRKPRPPRKAKTPPEATTPQPMYQMTNVASTTPINTGIPPPLMAARAENHLLPSSAMAANATFHVADLSSPSSVLQPSFTIMNPVAQNPQEVRLPAMGTPTCVSSLQFPNAALSGTQQPFTPFMLSLFGSSNAIFPNSEAEYCQYPPPSHQYGAPTQPN